MKVLVAGGKRVPYGTTVYVYDQGAIRAVVIDRVAAPLFWDTTWVQSRFAITPKRAVALAIRRLRSENSKNEARAALKRFERRNA